MPTAHAAVEYMLAAAKQTAEEVDDPVLAVTDLANHGADQYKESDDERIPQAEREHQHGEHKTSDGSKRGVGMTDGIAPDGCPRTLDETHGLIKIIGDRVMRLGTLHLGIDDLASRRGALIDSQARSADGLVLIGIAHRKPPRSGR